VLVVMHVSLAQMFVLHVFVRLVGVDHARVVVRMSVLRREVLPFADGFTQSFPLVMRDVVMAVFVHHRIVAVFLESPSHSQCPLACGCFEAGVIERLIGSVAGIGLLKG
jgi:hypothetical protein